jgi:hypothetical protein
MKKMSNKLHQLTGVFQDSNSQKVKSKREIVITELSLLQ